MSTMQNERTSVSGPKVLPAILGLFVSRHRRMEYVTLLEPIHKPESMPAETDFVASEKFFENADGEARN